MFRIILNLLLLLPLLSNAATLPLDTAVRIGHLPNGLTYYIRHNGYPAGHADFYIAQRVGSILEDDDQQGLAHFLEHMAFNGTRHFPERQMHQWLEGLGVRWGWDFNAFTSVDQTVYNISNVPLTRPTVADSCLLVLRDWACDVTLDTAEIDAERGVIHEEWRRGGKDDRMMSRLVPQMYPGSKYGQRLPIGKMEVVDSFPYQVLRDYYRRWYRPDQQAILVAGDVDVDSVEAKIRQMFGTIPMPPDAPNREYCVLPDHKGTIAASVSDPEQATTDVWLYFNTQAERQMPPNTSERMRQDYLHSMIERMLNPRMSRLAQAPGSPLASASLSFGQTYMAQNKDAVWSGITARQGQLDEAMANFYRELVRARRHGFTREEYDRARQSYRSEWDAYHDNAKSRTNGQLVQQMVANFTQGSSMMDVEAAYHAALELMESVTLDEVNAEAAAALGPDNRVLALLQPQGVDATTDHLLGVMAGVESEEIQPYVDHTRTDPLLPQLPIPGRVVATDEDPRWGATVMTLSNGATVVVKHTDFQEQEIMMQAYAPNGHKMFGPEYDSAVLTFDMFPVSIGSYTSQDLERWVNGRQIAVAADIQEDMRTLSGRTTPRDLGGFMEYLHGMLTLAHFDTDETEAARQRVADWMRGSQRDPGYVQRVFTDSVLIPGVRHHAPTLADVERTRASQLDEMARRLTANAADFTFVFVGNVDAEALTPLVEKYLASLPSTPTEKQVRPTPDEQDLPRPGRNTTRREMEMQTPMTHLLVEVDATVPYDLRTRMMTQMLSHILSTRLNADIRETLGATYAIGANAYLADLGRRNLRLQIPTPLHPELAQQAIQGINGILASMPGTLQADEVEAARQYLAKERNIALESNWEWTQAIVGEAMTGKDMFNGYESALAAITTEDLDALMREILAQGNVNTAILAPRQE